MSSLPLGSNPEFAKLQKEREFLLDRLGVLSAERENCLHVEGPNLVSLHYDKVGHLEVSTLKVEMECARIKREIELITAAINSGKNWDYEVITSQLDKEFQDWQQQVSREALALEEARKRLSSLLQPEESAKFRALYLKLVKELHPDVQPWRHPRLRPLWDRLQRAYQNGDLAEMELVELLLKDEQAAVSPSSRDELLRDIESLKANCQTLVDALYNLRQSYPFTLASLLSDPVALAEKQKDLGGKLLVLQQRRAGLQAHLDILLDSRP